MRKILLAILILRSFLFAFENQMGSMGYVRLQATLDDDKERVCFKAPDATSRYRLGNECEVWLEIGVKEDLKFDNGVVIHNQVRPVFFSQNTQKIDFLRWDEVYSEISNIFDNSVSFWAGRRYYKRKDSHLSDYWFLNMSGDGIGVNNLDLGGYTLSYSFMFNDITPTNIDTKKSTLFHSHDIRFAKNLNRGVATLFLNYMSIDGEKFNTDNKLDKIDGYAIGVIYEDKEILKELFSMSGTNISGIFYGDGAARGAGAISPYYQESLIENMIESSKDISNSKTFRFINYNDFQNDTLGIMSNFVYEYKDNESYTGEKQDWISAGIRPYLFLHNHTRVVMELGYDYINDRTSSNLSYGLLKTTTALEFALDKGVWERPVLRFYYTYASWSQDAKGLIGTDYYADKTAGSNAGVQVEYWW